MIGKIANRLISTLQARERPYRIQDSELKRFFIRVQPTGVMTYGCDVVLPDGRRSTRLIGRHGVFTPTQARDEARKILGDVARGIDPAEAKMKAREYTLKGFLDDRYIPWLKARQKTGDTYQDTRAEARANATIRMIEVSFPELLPKKLGQINPWIIEKWKMQTLNQGAKPSTVNRKMDALRAVLSKAIKWGKLGKNPLSEVEWCELDSKGVFRFLSDEEALQLEKAMTRRDERIRAERRSANAWRLERGYELMPDLDRVRFVDHLNPMIILSRNLGPRRAELFHLERRHVDLANRVVTFTGSNAKSGQTGHVNLNETAFSALRDWIEQNKITDGLIFPGCDGKPMNNVNKAWKALLKDAKIEGFRWHDQRHDFASRLVMSGVDLNTVRELMRHSDCTQTIRYAHLSPRVKAEAVARLDGPKAEKSEKAPDTKMHLVS